MKQVYGKMVLKNLSSKQKMRKKICSNTRAIWKATSSVLLTKQAMRKKIIIYKKYAHT
jgi:hypothetical protein